VYAGSAWTLAHATWLARQRFDSPLLGATFSDYHEAVLATRRRRDGLDVAILELASDPPWAPLVARRPGDLARGGHQARDARRVQGPVQRVAGRARLVGHPDRCGQTLAPLDDPRHIDRHALAAQLARGRVDHPGEHAPGVHVQTHPATVAHPAPPMTVALSPPSAATHAHS